MVGLAPALANQVFLDQPVKAGDLTVFPSIVDAKQFRYIPDQVRLATNASGGPDFMFQRWVENVRTGADEAEAREGEGGGIVRGSVLLEVSDNQLREAERELQRKTPGAKIVGPMIYTSGAFTVICATRNPEEGLVKTIVGEGSAPILDGQKAAFSMLLTKKGAKILWEQFDMASPDITFQFDMQVDGFLSPISAHLEADLKSVSQHHSFGLGIASKYLEADIRGALSDCVREGTIKLTQVGSDANMDRAIMAAYDVVLNSLFQPARGTGVPSFDDLSRATGNQGNMLDRASRMLQRGREEARSSGGSSGGGRSEATPSEAGGGAARPASGGESRPAAGGGASATPGRDDDEPRPATEPRDQQTTSEGAGAAEGGSEPASDEAISDPDTVSPGRERASASARRSERPSEDPRTLSSDTPARPRAEREAADGRAGSGRGANARGGGSGDSDEPTIAIGLYYEFRRDRLQTKLNVSLEKTLPITRPMMFTQNIGSLREYKDNPAYFQEINLEQPLYLQREIVCFVDGLNAADFGEYINFVTVRMRKTHAEGAVTDDEVRIDRKNFNSEGNAFKLLYGWKGDNNRRRWMEYEYQTIWSFFGGATVEEPWRRATAGAIAVVPPYQRRKVALEADPDMLGEAEVRLVTVKLYYDLGGVERVRQESLNPAKDETAKLMEFMLPGDTYDYEYEISWRLKGNKSVSAPRQRSSETVLFVDELPEG